MASIEQHLDLVLGEDKSEWVSEVPADLAEIIAIEYGPADRERLAQVAASNAAAEIRPAYQSPFIRQAALQAARLALGLKPLPEQGEI